MIDDRDILRNEKPFSYQIVKGGKARVSWRGRMIKVLSEKDTSRLQNLEGDDFAVQLFLARKTGHFKHV